MFFLARFMPRLCLLGVFVSFVIIHAENASGVVGPITYAEIGEQFIKNFPASSRIAPEKKEGKYVTPLSLADKSKYALEAIGTSNAYTSSAHNEKSLEALRNLHHDIELFSVLFPRINKTRTVFGTAVLAKMLSTPLTDVDVLKNKQVFIELLLEDEELFNELAALLEKIHEQESALLSYWAEETPAVKELIKGFYFKNIFTEGLNGSVEGLEVAARWSVAATLWPLISDLVGQAIVKYAFDAKIARTKPTVPDVLYRTFNDMYNPFAVWQDCLDYKNGKHDEYLKRVYSTLSIEGKSTQELAAEGFAGLKFVQLVGMPLQMILKWYTIQEARQNLNLRMSTAYMLQERLAGFSTALEVFDSLAHYMTEDPVIEHGLVARNKIKKLCKPTMVSADFADLIKTLKTDTFKGEPSFFSILGRVLFAHRLMKKHKNEFAPLFELLGEVDACMSIAQLIKEYKDKRVHCCFAQLIESQTPYLQLTNFWNPMVDSSIVVPNSIEFGASGMRSMVLTGSNTGGKSTLLKGMLINALFGQTLGILMADHGKMTPFVYLGSSLNIVDNTQGGKSLFQAEVDRAVSLINAAKYFNGIGHCLLVIDELFRGTSPDKAELKTYECAKSILEQENTILVLATHYKKYVINLEQETAGLCKNYKIDVQVAADGKAIIRPFLLQEGVSNNNVATTIVDNALQPTA